LSSSYENLLICQDSNLLGTSFLIHTTCLGGIAIIAEREIIFSSVFDSDIYVALKGSVING